MKKILILGSTGMMGSMLSSLLRNDQRFNILCTYRNTNKVKFLDLKKKQKTKIEIFNKHELNKLIHKFNPDYLINCIGLIKQLCRKENLQFIKYLNTDLPKIIALSAKKNKFNVIHLSTDCVFSGNKGNYTELDFPDAKDIYGISKFHGEIESKSVINIRTSIIGHELTTNLSLLNWFLRQKKIGGFKKAYFSGLTTLELSKIIIKEIILKNKISHGLFHISGPKISKYNLLKLINKIYNRKTIINIDNNFKIDRSLNSNKFRKITNLKKKNWSTMIEELKKVNENI